MSIKHRLTLVTLAAILLSLATTVGGLFTFEYFNFRDRLKSDVEKSADFVAGNSSAAILFGDPDTATENLSVLNTDTRVVHGSIVLADGTEFATFGDMPSEFTGETFNASQAAQIRGEYATITRPIYVDADSEVVGYVTIVADMSEWQERVSQLMFVVPSLALISMALAWMASRRWQRSISEPLLALTSEVRTIQEEKDYDRSVDIQADGEVGQLIEGVNAMLETVQQSQLELKAVNTMLDQRVQERTAELEEEVQERTKAENEVRRSQQIVDDFLDNAPLGIAWVSADGKIERCNQVLEEILECGFQELNGAPLKSFFESEELVDGLFARLKNDETISVLEAKIRSPHGSIRWVQISASVLWDKGHFVFAGVFLLDISDLKASEEVEDARHKLERANKAKNDFLSRMSHELRTPMNAILGFAQLLEFTDLDKRDKDCVDNILTAGRHLLSLIEEVLNISKIESGKLRLSLEPIPLSLVVDEVCGLLNPMATDHNVTLHRTIDQSSEFVVSADRQRLVQVLVNLLGNAIKYNKPEGAVSIWIEEDDEQMIRVYVKDTGIGLPVEKLDRLFIPFERLGVESSKIEGTGLGLALSKSLMMAMGGDIELVDTRPGIGSTFAVVLPISAELTAPLGDSALLEQSGMQASPSKHVSVLCIEDNELNVELIAQFVSRQEGYELTVTRRGEDGLKKLDEQSFDCVLLDLHLPDMPGKEVLQRIRSRKDRNEIPVVIVSADVNPDTVSMLMALGADAFCGKPINLRELAETIDELTENNAA